MIASRNVLAVVPARGGSKGIPLKNLIQINGKSLIQYVAEVLRELTFIDRSIVSTDHSGIATAAKDAGLLVPFTRPNDLSGDLISDVDVLTHAIHFMEKQDELKYDIVVMLQPTSPFRKPEHVTEVVLKLVEGQYDSVLTVSETDLKAHPLKQLLFVDEKLDYFDNRGREIIARQQLEPVFHRNGIAYAMTRDCLLGQRVVIGENCSAVLIRGTVVNIDSLEDIQLAEACIADQVN